MVTIVDWKPSEHDVAFSHFLFFLQGGQWNGPNGTIRYDKRYYFKVRSKADMNQLNLPHGTDR